MKKIIFFLFFISFIVMAYAQQIVESTERENVYFRVNQLNDFIDRFNKVENSFFLNYVKKRWDDSIIVSRIDLLNSLFYDDGEKLNEAIKAKFINQVISNNIRISEKSNDWYAKVNCTFVGKRKELDLDLILKFVYDIRYDGFKWEIIKVEKLQNNKSKKRFSAVKSDKQHVISPVSNEIHFIDLRRYLSDLDHLADYFNELKGANEENFIYQLQTEKMKFKQVGEISYHFLQIEGWIFRVSYIDENKLNPKNTGWLITNIMEVDLDEKNKYELEELSFKN